MYCVVVDVEVEIWDSSVHFLYVRAHIVTSADLSGVHSRPLACRYS